MKILKRFPFEPLRGITPSGEHGGGSPHPGELLDGIHPNGGGGGDSPHPG